MTWLSDRAVLRLQSAAERPDFSGTRYRLLEQIGRGGMGVVYEADDEALGRRVAVKVLAAELASSTEADRLRREARTVAGLEHPGIVPGPRRRRAAGRPRVLRDEARARRAARRMDGAVAFPDGPASRLSARLRGGRVRARERSRAPGSQAAQRHGRRVRRGSRHGLGARAKRADERQPRGVDRGHARLDGARAGTRR